MFSRTEGVLLDVSEGGFAITSPVDIDRKDFLFLEFVPESEVISINIALLGQVVNRVPRGERAFLVSAQIPKGVPAAYRTPLARYIEIVMESG